MNIRATISDWLRWRHSFQFVRENALRPSSTFADVALFFLDGDYTEVSRAAAAAGQAGQLAVRAGHVWLADRLVWLEKEGKFGRCNRMNF